MTRIVSRTGEGNALVAMAEATVNPNESTLRGRGGDFVLAEVLR